MRLELKLKYMSILGVIAGSMILVSAQSEGDLLKQIQKIKAIDNHSHVEKVVSPGESDDEGDAIGCGGLEFLAPPPVRLRSDNPIYLDAWQGLFGYKASAMDAKSLTEYLSIKQKVISEKGDKYSSWVLDKLNIDIMLANRVSMGRGLNNERFRWVTYGDPYLLPFSTMKIRMKNSDQQFFYAQEQKLLKRFMSEGNLSRLPGTFDEYLTRFVSASLDRQKATGAVAVKFVLAYYRTLETEEVTRSEAARIYRSFVSRSEPPPAVYKKFQDFMFRYVATEAGKRGLVVHIHTGGGCGHYFNLRTSNPLLLESMLNDPQLRNTKFVLVHGGYPFFRETEFLIEKPNVYADFSAQTFLLSPNALSRVLQSWLEYEPEKVLFGTDASPTGPEVGWEESAWMTTDTARRALAIALTKMIREGEIDFDRAVELANMVMRRNAARLYQIEN